jgi:hypothetical protein
MVATIGPGWAIAADAFTFFLSAMFLARIRTARRPGRQKATFLRDLADGWRVFRSETWLWVDGVYSALGNGAVFAPFLALGPVVALRSLGGGGAWATIIAALGVGSISAGLVLLRARPARPLFVGVVLLSLLALPTALLALPAPTVVIAVGALAGGFGLSVFNSCFGVTVGLGSGKRSASARGRGPRRRSSGLRRSYLRATRRAQASGRGAGSRRDGGRRAQEASAITPKTAGVTMAWASSCTAMWSEAAPA